MLLRKLKVLCALGIFIAMFLPLAQCTSAEFGEIPEKTKVLKVVDISKPPQAFIEAVPAMIFAFPLFLMLFTLWGKREKLRHELLDFLAGLMLISLIYVFLFFAKLLYGAYIALGLAGLFSLLSLVESIQTIKARGGLFANQNSEDLPE